MYVFISLVISLLALAPKAEATEAICSKPNSTADVLNCVERYHPDSRQTETNPVMIEGLRRSATQYANPTLSVQTTKGKNLGDTIGEDVVSVSQLIEIGGKRSARRRVGEAKVKAVNVSATLTKAQIRMQALLALIRYRQLLSEISVLEEALSTYDRVHRQFAARPRLSPDQQVTFSLFKLSMGDYRHRLAALEAERRKAESYFKLVPELNIAEALKHLPPRLAKWPKFDAAPTNIETSPNYQAALADYKEAEATADLADANAWPDPTVSLIGTREVDGFATFNRYGVGVSIPLPVLNVNGGERRQARALKTRAEIETRRVATQISIDRTNLIQSYEGFVKSFELAPQPKDIDSKHKNTESLFYRGVVSGVLVIEAHRQILDFTQSQNELEYETAQALLNLYLIDGRIEEFSYE